MSIGLGLVLILIGLVLTMRVVTFDVAWVDEYRLGALLIIIGAIGVVLSLVVYGMRRRSTHVVERHNRVD